MRQKRFILYIAVFSLCATFLIARAVRASRQPIVQWPSFTMVYEEWAYGFGVNGAPGTQRIKITYTNLTHWRTEVLAQPGAPDHVGAWGSYDGQTVHSFDPVFGKEVHDLSKEHGIHTPTEWLWPIYIPNLLKKSNVQDLGAQDQTTKALVRTEQLPCQTSVPAQQRAALPPCTKAFRLAEHRIVYRGKENIPVQITDTLDGVLMSKITVLDLQLK